MPPASNRERWLLGLCLGVAVLQTVLAQHLDGRYHDDYWVTLGVAWTVALVLAWEGSRRAAPRPEAFWMALGVLAIAAGVVPLAAFPLYRAFDRFLPLLAGAGLCLVGFGPRGLLRHRNGLLLLTLPMMNPLPEAIRLPIQPTSWTAWCASIVGRGVGHPMSADGSVLRLPTGTLDVLADCGGMMSIGRLWVLAAVVVALFPTKTWQKASLVASAVVVGFVANAVRVEMLAVTVANGDTAAFEYWHEGRGASIFAVAVTAAVGPVWWLILRRRSRGGPPGGTSSVLPTSPAALT
jgi:cyanoexosortase A